MRMECHCYRPRYWRRVAVTLVSLVCVTNAQNTASFTDLVAKATQARETNDIAQSISLYQQALALNPKWSDGWWYLGLLEYQTNQYAQARDALANYLQTNPDAGPALALRGLCEFHTEDFGQSLKDIQHGLILGAANQPRNARILRYHEAVLLAYSGKFEEALSRYAYFAKAGISDPDVLLATGLAGLRIAMLPSKVPPEDQDFIAAVGQAAWTFMKGDQDGAQLAFQNLFQRFPTAAGLHYLYGFLLYPEDPGAAIVQFKQELDKFPTNSLASAMLAWAYLMRNEPSSALPFAQKAAEEAPSQAISLLVLGRALVDTGAIRDGIASLQKALVLEPDNLEIHIALAKAYSESGRRDDARRERQWCLRATSGMQHENP
jgi:tetratricopeptide (TPR) repeat protein